MCRRLSDFLWRVEARRNASRKPLRTREEIREAVRYVELRSERPALLIEASRADHFSVLHDRDRYLGMGYGRERGEALFLPRYVADELNSILVRMWFALEDGDLAGWTRGAETLLRLSRLQAWAPHDNAHAIARRVDDLIRARLSSGVAGSDELALLAITHDAFEGFFDLPLAIELARLRMYSDSVMIASEFAFTSDYFDEDTGLFSILPEERAVIDAACDVYAHAAATDRWAVDAMDELGFFEKHEKALREHPRFGRTTNSLRALTGTYRRERAIRDGVAIMIALERRRCDVGRYPGLLDQLVPEYLDEVPVDWFSGEAFRYELSRDGSDYTLYSVAENGVDDGGATHWRGQPLPENPRERKLDRVFHGPGLVRSALYPDVTDSE